MKNVIEFIKKNKFYIVVVFMAFFFMRSCSKSTKIRKHEKQDTEYQEHMVKLNNLINNQISRIDDFPETLRQEKIDIHIEYDNWISDRDRGSQLMELHRLVKKNIGDLQN